MKNIFLPIILSTFFLCISTYSQSAFVKRSCQTRIEFQFLDNHGLLSHRFSSANFNSNGRCFIHEVNKCRRIARNAGISCIENFWKNSSFVRRLDCSSNANAFPLDGVKKKDFIENEVCDYLNYFAKNNRDSARVKITARSSGNSGCKKDEVLENSYEVNCRNYLSKAARRNVVRHQRSGSRSFPSMFSLRNRKCKKRKCDRDLSFYRKRSYIAQKNFMGDYNHQSDSHYLGCGRHAAQNVLNFYGIKYSLQDLTRDIAGIEFYKFSENIATLPDQLKVGLKKLLNKSSRNKYKVELFHGKSQFNIVSALNKKKIVIALVNGGSHWVTVMGYKVAPTTLNKVDYQFIVANNWKTEVWSFRDLSLGFKRDAALAKELLSKLPNGNSSYRPGTFLTVSLR